MLSWTRGAILALGFAVAGCVEERTGAVLATAPARLGGAEPASDRDHGDLVASFGGEYRSAALEAILRETAADLVARSERPDESFTVTILDSPKVNAFALPSGRLYVTRGLLALASDTSEVAAVLAHEMAHVTRGHSQRRTEHEARSALVSRVAADILNDRRTSALILDRSRLALAGFSRGQEFEADAVGIATAAAAGYDPVGAVRVLNALGRQADLDRLAPDEAPTGSALKLSSHPATAHRIALAREAARLFGGAGAAADRRRWLAALDGIPYGDRPKDGLVRGRSFIHPGLAVAFEAPDGMSLENTPAAVLGASRDGSARLLFDAVNAPAERELGEVLASGWSDALEPGSIRTVMVNGRPVALAASRGREWSFRLAALRIGPTTFRLILGGRGSGLGALDRARDATLASLREVGPEEAAALRPQRVAVIVAEPGDTTATLAARMRTDRPRERFLALNGIGSDGALTPGESYKVVVE